MRHQPFMNRLPTRCQPFTNPSYYPSTNQLASRSNGTSQYILCNSWKNTQWFLGILILWVAHHFCREIYIYIYTWNLYIFYIPKTTRPYVGKYSILKMNLICIYLEPVNGLYPGVWTHQKKALYNQNKGHLGYRCVYISIYMYCT